MYTSTVHSEEDLLARIPQAAATVRQQLGILERTLQSLVRRCQLY